MSPSLTYVATITPLVEALQSKSLNEAGNVPSPKRRLPAPNRDWKNLQAKLIHEVILEQCLD